MGGPNQRKAHLDFAATHLSPLSSESLSEAHSSPMSGKVKTSVLGPGPEGIQVLGSRSPGPGWRGFRGLATTLLLLHAGPATEGRAAQTPPRPVGGCARAAKWAGELVAL